MPMVYTFLTERLLAFPVGVEGDEGMIVKETKFLCRCSRFACHFKVDLLVPVMERLSTWTRPVVMIPGNHDQVTLGGGMHALTPLQFVFMDAKQVRQWMQKDSAVQSRFCHVHGVMDRVPAQLYCTPELVLGHNLS